MSYSRPQASAPVINEFRDWRNAMVLYRGGVYKSPIGLLSACVAERGVLHYADLSGYAFASGRVDGLQAPGARFSNSTFKQVMLADADLRWADFGGCQVEQLSLRNSDLAFARLPLSQLNNIDLTGARNLETAILLDDQGQPVSYAFTADGQLYDRRGGPAPERKAPPPPETETQQAKTESPRAEAPHSDSTRADAGHRAYQQQSQQQQQQQQAEREKARSEQAKAQQESQQQRRQEPPKDDGFTSWFDGFARRAKAAADDWQPWTPPKMDGAAVNGGQARPRAQTFNARPQASARPAPPVRQKFEIKTKGGAKVIHTGVGTSLGDVLEAAIRAKVSFKRGGLDLGTKITGRNLKTWDFRAAGAPGLILERCDISDCQTYMSDLTAVRFINVTAVGGNFEAARMENSILNGNFRKAKMQLAWMDGVVFDGCDLAEATLTIERLKNVTFKNCKNLDKVVLVNDTGHPQSDWVLTAAGPQRKSSAGPQAARKP